MRCCGGENTFDNAALRSSRCGSVSGVVMMVRVLLLCVRQTHAHAQQCDSYLDLGPTQPCAAHRSR